MSYNEAETRFWLIDPVLRDKGYNKHWKLRLETPAQSSLPTAKAAAVPEPAARIIFSAYNRHDAEAASCGSH
jgi:hypothetical protein